jgi:ribosomal protein S6
MSQEENTVDINETKLYELAFNIIPTISDAEVKDVFGGIKDMVSKIGKVVASSEPAHIPLAYVMEKSIDTKKQKYNTAYFSWIKFEATPEVIDQFQKDLDLNKAILRYMVIKSDKESTISAQELAQVLRGDEEKEVAVEEGEKVVETDSVVEADKNDVAEIDKAIDDLVN